MVVGIGLAVLRRGGIVIPRIARCIRTKFHCATMSSDPDNPQRNTLLVSLGFWPGSLEENGSGYVDQLQKVGLTQTLAAGISKSIYNDIILDKVSFYG